MDYRTTYNWNYIYDLNREVYLKTSKPTFFKDEDVQSRSYSNAIILPYERVSGSFEAKGGILDENGEFIPQSKQRIAGTDVVEPYTPDSVEENSKRVMWFGYFHNHWGHFLTEMISRCWYLVEHNPTDEDFYVTYGLKTDSCKEEMTGSFREFLNLLGVPNERIILVDRATRFPEVIIPERCSERMGWYNNQYLAIFDKLKSKVNVAKKYERIYLTRLGSKEFANTQIGERPIMKVFKKAGYRVIAPERLSLTEQITAIKSCKKMVIVSGSMTHNMMFCTPGTDVTILNRGKGIDIYQPPVSEASRTNITYVDCNLAFWPVFAYIPVVFYFSEQFCRYCEDNGLNYKRYKEGFLRLHAKLTWYFLSYLQHMSGGLIEEWKMDNAGETGILSTYKFYRDLLTDFDSEKQRKMRSGAFKVMKALLRL